MTNTNTPWGMVNGLSPRGYAQQLTSPLQQAWLDNISAVVTIADSATMQQAQAWFPRERARAEEATRDTPYTPQQYLGVLAALSVHLRWNVNLRCAIRSVQEECAVCNTYPNRARAQAILDGATPGDVLGSLKIGAFYRNLVGYDDRATIDMWVARMTTREPTRVTQRNYFYIERHVMATAAALRMATSDLVALLWIVGRGSHE